MAYTKIQKDNAVKQNDAMNKYWIEFYQFQQTSLAEIEKQKSTWLINGSGGDYIETVKNIKQQQTIQFANIVRKNGILEQLFTETNTNNCGYLTKEDIITLVNSYLFLNKQYAAKLAIIAMNAKTNNSPSKIMRLLNDSSDSSDISDNEDDALIGMMVNAIGGEYAEHMNEFKTEQQQIIDDTNKIACMQAENTAEILLDASDKFGMDIFDILNNQLNNKSGRITKDVFMDNFVYALRTTFDEINVMKFMFQNENNFSEKQKHQAEKVDNLVQNYLADIKEDLKNIQNDLSDSSDVSDSHESNEKVNVNNQVTNNNANNCCVIL